MFSATLYHRHDTSDNKAGKSPVELAPPCSLSLMQRHNNSKKKKGSHIEAERNRERNQKPSIEKVATVSRHLKVQANCKHFSKSIVRHGSQSPSGRQRSWTRCPSSPARSHRPARGSG